MRLTRDVPLGALRYDVQDRDGLFPKIKEALCITHGQGIENRYVVGSVRNTLQECMRLKAARPSPGLGRCSSPRWYRRPEAVLAVILKKVLGKFTDATRDRRVHWGRHGMSSFFKRGNGCNGYSPGTPKVTKWTVWGCASLVGSRSYTKQVDSIEKRGSPLGGSAVSTQAAKTQQALGKCPHGINNPVEWGRRKHLCN